MIPDEAVEAAARAYTHAAPYLSTKNAIREAIEAAAPHIMAEALTKAAAEYERFAHEDADAYSYTDAWTWLRHRADDISSAGAGE